MLGKGAVYGTHGPHSPARGERDIRLSGRIWGSRVYDLARRVEHYSANITCVLHYPLASSVRLLIAPVP